MRECEGFGYEETLKELKALYPDDEEDMDEGSGMPNAIRSMLGCNTAVEALGSMIW